MSNKLISTKKVKGPVDPDSGFAEVLMTANIEAIMQKKAAMLQEFEENESGVRRCTFTAPKTGQSVEYIITQGKPFNLYTIQPVVGRLPNDLSGSYTSFEKAETAIKGYLATRKESYYDEVIGNPALQPKAIAKEVNGDRPNT